MPAPAQCEAASLPTTTTAVQSPSPPGVVAAPQRIAIAEPASVLGLLLGLLAATCYSITNIGLRQLSDVQDGMGWDLWVCGIKALPTVLITGWMLLRSRNKVKAVAPSRRMLWVVLGTALMMQFGGNFGFQLALRSIGLAISVPIVFSSIICSGAIAGRMALGDPVGVRTGLSMGLMVASIVFLSGGAQAGASIEAAASANPSSALGVFAGIICGLISGVSYGLGGVVIRRAVQKSIPVPLILFLFCIVGVLTLCPLGAIPMGVDGLLRITASDWALLLGSGLFNAFGFFAITHALRYLNVNKANVVNAAQNAMCAVAGFALFAEPMTAMTLTGIALAITGLLVLGRR